MGNTVSDSEFHVVGPQMANCFDHILFWSNVLQGKCGTT